VALNQDYGGCQVVQEVVLWDVANNSWKMCWRRQVPLLPLLPLLLLLMWCCLQAAPTIVMTQRGARSSFQAHLRSLGVEVVEFDFLTPGAVADYCYERGFLKVCVE
jgi:hypothetical protein